MYGTPHCQQHNPPRTLTRPATRDEQLREEYEDVAAELQRAESDAAARKRRERELEKASKAASQDAEAQRSEAESRERELQEARSELARAREALSSVQSEEGGRAQALARQVRRPLGASPRLSLAPYAIAACCASGRQRCSLTRCGPASLAPNAELQSWSRRSTS